MPNLFVFRFVLSCANQTEKRLISRLEIEGLEWVDLSCQIWHHICPSIQKGFVAKSIWLAIHIELQSQHSVTHFVGDRTTVP